MKHLHPYAPIEKARLSTDDGMKSRGFTVRIADDDATSGWSECGLVSEDYLLVPNTQVRDMAQEIADRSGLRFTEDKLFFDGKRFVYGLVAKDEGLIDIRVGDPVGIGIMFENSYDGSRRLSASLYVHRLACSNGMIVPKLFQHVKFKHDRSGRGWEEEVQKSLAMVRHAHMGLQRFVGAAQNLTSMRVNASRLREIRTDVLPKLPVTLWGKVIDRFLMHETLDGFGLVNAGTNVLWHDKGTAITNFSWNEYLTTGLIEYGLGEIETVRRN